jgi:hypothetical protein
MTPDWKAFALDLLKITRLPATSTCVDDDPAGASYEVRPAPVTLAMFRHIIPGISEDDFGIAVGVGYGRDTCYPLFDVAGRVEERAKEDDKG